MQQNETQDQVPPYAKTLGFRIIQQADTDNMPDDLKDEISKALAKLSEVSADDVESLVVVARLKAEDHEGKRGFGLVVAALGSEELVIGSSMMLSEYLTAGIGGPGAMMARVGAFIGGGGGGFDEAPDSIPNGDGIAGIKVVVDNTVTSDPKDVAAVVEAACNGVGADVTDVTDVTKH